MMDRQYADVGAALCALMLVSYAPDAVAFSVIAATLFALDQWIRRYGRIMRP